ncbi:MAG: metallophosphoesterase family protein [Akkermansiaceae bacterium]
MKKETATKGRTLAIGDIHGCLDALKTLEEFVGFSENDTIITLGDYIDRGPDSKGVIDWLISGREKYNLITLAGNHELMMEDSKHSAAAHYFWSINGGESTLMSFDCCVEDVPTNYWQFIKSCELFYETDSHIFVHAGLEPSLAPEDQNPDTLCWLRFGNLKPHDSNKTIICGHTPQKSHIPGILPHAICIDTHAFNPRGYLTCLDVETGDYWQASNQGIKRKKTLELTDLTS